MSEVFPEGFLMGGHKEIQVLDIAEGKSCRGERFSELDGLSDGR